MRRFVVGVVWVLFQTQNPPLALCDVSLVNGEVLRIPTLPLGIQSLFQSSRLYWYQFKRSVESQGPVPLHTQESNLLFISHVCVQRCGGGAWVPLLNDLLCLIAVLSVNWAEPTTDVRRGGLEDREVLYGFWQPSLTR